MPTIPVIRPETALLLQCARTSRSPETTDRIKALIREGIDWDDVLQAAHRHGMAPLLYWHLDAIHPEEMPESTLTHLRDYFHATSQRNLFLAGELLRLLSVFTAQEIPIIPYKGPTLAASIYGNLTLREFSDLDILVKRHHVPKAEEVLVSMGYKLYRSTQTQEAVHLQSRVRRDFMLGDGKSIVELHWGIVPIRYSFPFDTERLWERLEEVRIGGHLVPSLSPEDMLLVLCIHGYKHLWEQLGWICDVAELIRTHQDMNWEQLMAHAKSLDGERMLFLGLVLASDLLGADPPERVRERAWADPTVKAIAERIRAQQLFQETGEPDYLFRAYAQLQLRKSLAHKIGYSRALIRYCVRIAITPSLADREMMSLPDFLSPVYYVLRLIRLTGKYGAMLLKRIL